jgi:hypothetical protein
MTGIDHVAQDIVADRLASGAAIATDKTKKC